MTTNTTDWNHAADWNLGTVETDNGPTGVQLSLADYADGDALVRLTTGKYVAREDVLDTTGLPTHNVNGHPLTRCYCGNVAYLPAGAICCPACDHDVCGDHDRPRPCVECA